MIVCNIIDRAKPPARRGCSAYASESDTTIRHSSFVIRHSSFPACPGWGIAWNCYQNWDKQQPFSQERSLKKNQV